MGTWEDGTPGLLELPSGRRVRGRAWRDLPPGPAPDLGIYLLGRPPGPPPWEFRWVRWHDFSLPADPDGVPAAEAVAFGKDPVLLTPRKLGASLWTGPQSRVSFR